MLRLFVIVGLLLGCSVSVLAQGVGIGTATPHPSAKLDVTATNRGFLPPRMTSVQRNAIPAPAAGLVIYNTTSNCLEFWNGTAWMNLCTTPPPPCAFTQALGATSGSAATGTSLNITVTLGITTPTVGNMTTTITGLPTGVTVGGITNNPRSTAGNQVITLNIGGGATPGTYILTITTTAANGCNGPISATYTLTITNIPCPPQPCDLVNGNLIIFSCYEAPANTWTINIDQNIPNLRVGIVFYDANPAPPATINLTGAFVGNVTGVYVASYNASTVTGVSSSIVTRRCLTCTGGIAPGTCVDTRTDPIFGTQYGWPDIIGGYKCEDGTDNGGVNTQGEIEHFMLTQFPGSTLRWHEMKYSYTSNTFNVSAARSSCCQSVYP